MVQSSFLILASHSSAAIRLSLTLSLPFLVPFSHSPSRLLHLLPTFFLLNSSPTSSAVFPYSLLSLPSSFPPPFPISPTSLLLFSPSLPHYPCCLHLLLPFPFNPLLPPTPPPASPPRPHRCSPVNPFTLEEKVKTVTSDTCKRLYRAAFVSFLSVLRHFSARDSFDFFSSLFGRFISLMLIYPEFALSVNRTDTKLRVHSACVKFFALESLKIHEKNMKSRFWNA